jgi:hypothetical protein
MEHLLCGSGAALRSLPPTVPRAARQLTVVAVDRGENWRVDGEIQARRERDGAQHAYGILLKALFGDADAANQTRPDVLQPADEVDDRPRLDIIEERVQREIASKGVLFRRRKVLSW